MLKLSFFIKISKTSSIFALILILAILSRGVFYKLIITNAPPFNPVVAAILAAGATLKLEPIASIKSAFSPF
jgi:hypothetical protein